MAEAESENVNQASSSLRLLNLRYNLGENILHNSEEVDSLQRICLMEIVVVAFKNEEIIDKFIDKSQTCNWSDVFSTESNWKETEKNIFKIILQLQIPKCFHKELRSIIHYMGNEILIFLEKLGHSDMNRLLLRNLVFTQQATISTVKSVLKVLNNENLSKYSKVKLAMQYFLGKNVISKYLEDMPNFNWNVEQRRLYITRHFWKWQISGHKNSFKKLRDVMYYNSVTDSSYSSSYSSEDEEISLQNTDPPQEQISREGESPPQKLVFAERKNLHKQIFMEGENLSLKQISMAEENSPHTKGIVPMIYEGISSSKDVLIQNPLSSIPECQGTKEETFNNFDTNENESIEVEANKRLEEPVEHESLRSTNIEWKYSFALLDEHSRTLTFDEKSVLELMFYEAIKIKHETALEYLWNNFSFIRSDNVCYMETILRYGISFDNVNQAVFLFSKCDKLTSYVLYGGYNFVSALIKNLRWNLLFLKVYEIFKNFLENENHAELLSIIVYKLREDLEMERCSILRRSILDTFLSKMPDNGKTYIQYVQKVELLNILSSLSAKCDKEALKILLSIDKDTDTFINKCGLNFVDRYFS